MCDLSAVSWVGNDIPFCVDASDGVGFCQGEADLATCYDHEGDKRCECRRRCRSPRHTAPSLLLRAALHTGTLRGKLRTVVRGIPLGCSARAGATQPRLIRAGVLRTQASG